jgi:hypothetical protein
MNAHEIPWYRQPMVWLVIAIPAATVPAGLATVAIAMRGADPVVADDYRVEALGVTRDAARDVAAANEDVHASMVASGNGTMTLELRVAGGRLPQELVLRLSHATLASADRNIRLAWSGGRSYRADISPLAPGRWRAELEPGSRKWRLVGEFQAPLQRLTLAPRAGP